MVSVAINRNNGVFDEKVADELNKSFYSLNKKIEAYKPEPLEYKDTISYISNSDSFYTENMLHIRERFITENTYPVFTKVLDLSYDVPLDVWINLQDKESTCTLMCHILNRGIAVYGDCDPGKEFYIVADIIIP